MNEFKVNNRDDLESYFLEIGEKNIYRKIGLGYSVKMVSLYLTILYAYPILMKIIVVISSEQYNLFNSLIIEIFQYFLLILISIIMTLLSRYGIDSLDHLFGPYGKKTSDMQKLYVNKRKYLEQSKIFFETIFNAKRIIIVALISFSIYIIVLIYNFPGHFGLIIGNQTILLPPFDVICYYILNIAIMLTFTYNILIIFVVASALIKIFKLRDSVDDFAITQYNRSLKELLINKNISDQELSQNLRNSYFHFQKANRNIGELLFNFTVLLIIISIIIAIAPFIVSIILPDFRTQAIIFIYIGTFMSIISTTFFLLPQLGIHHVLNDKKKETVEILTQKRELLESFYLTSIQNPEFLHSDSSWKTRQDILVDIEFIKSTIQQTNKYGTWAYDFPAVIKIFIINIAAIFPIILPFISV